MVPGGFTDYSHRAASHYPLVSSSVSLHCALTFQLLFLSHFSIAYLLLSVAPGISECLRSSQEWFQECNAPLVNYDTGQGSSQACPTPVQACAVPN